MYTVEVGVETGTRWIKFSICFKENHVHQISVHVISCSRLGCLGEDLQSKQSINFTRLGRDVIPSCLFTSTYCPYYSYSFGQSLLSFVLDVFKLPKETSYQEDYLKRMVEFCDIWIILLDADGMNMMYSIMFQPFLVMYTHCSASPSIICITWDACGNSKFQVARATCFTFSTNFVLLVFHAKLSQIDHALEVLQRCFYMHDRSALSMHYWKCHKI